MMQCPACRAPLVAGEARCLTCQALVNPPTQGASALAPRLVTPQSVEGFGEPPPTPPSRGRSAAKPPATATDRPSNFTGSRNPADEAWRQEVLERVRKRRQVRTHVLPLFADRDETAAEADVPAPSPAPNPVPAPVTPEGAITPPPPTMAPLPLPATPLGALPLDAAIVEHLSGVLESIDPRPAPPSPDLIASFSVENEAAGSDNLVMDLPLRPAEADANSSRPRTEEVQSQTLVERPRPTLVMGSSSPRSLVADLPLVEPSPVEPPPVELPPRAPQSARNPRVASMSDRLQAAFIDLGLWSFTCVTAFYFASRIARTSILGLAPSWPGLALFSLVIAAAYVLFFGGLTGATPGKIACGIQVRRYDGSSLGPLASLGRGCLGILSVAFLGVGVWPAFWDRDRRTLHDRATRSRVTLV